MSFPNKIKLFLEVSLNVKMIQNYMKIWEPFRDMWEIDKELFLQRYEVANPNAATFDADIGRYTEVANNCQIQETVTSVHFILLNCGDLKKSIIAHCIEWQEKLCALLFKLTLEKVDHIYEYTKKNSEM